MHIRTFLKPLSFLPAIFMMYIIYMFSSQEADLSSSVSHRASVVIVESADYVLDMNLDDWQVESYAERIHGVTRKLAHMTEYFLLAIAVSFPLYVYGLHGILLVLIAGIFCLGFACTDEYHQSFVAGRAPAAKDVMIDGFGILIGIILVRIIGWTGRHTIFRPIRNKSNEQYSRRELKNLQKQQRRMQDRMDRYEENAGEYQNDPAPGPYYEEDPRCRQYYGEDPRARQYYGEDPREPYRREDDALYNRRNSADPYYGDPRYSDPYYDDPYYDEPEEAPDDLADDMPLSKFLKGRRR